MGVDRRTVRATANTIIKDEKLRGIFENLMPAGALLRDAAGELDFGVVEIEADAGTPGYLHLQQDSSQIRYKYKAGPCRGP